MSAPVFVVDRERLVEGAMISLDGPEGRHAATVQRLGPGEPVVLTDGHGRRAECLVVASFRDRLDLNVLACTETAPPEPRLVVVQALPKGERGEQAVAAMTEVGVDAIVPWAAARCITRWRADRAEKALSRWRTTAREAAKQSRRTHFPEVAELSGAAEVAGLLRKADLAVVLHEAAGSALAGTLPPATGEVVVVVGPEGGITPEELDAFEAAGATSYRIGPTVLRTSTAGVAALAVLQSRTDRWA